MKEKMIKSGLLAISATGLLLLGSCTSQEPNPAIFNSRGGHMPPPSSSNRNIDIAKPANPTWDDKKDDGILLNNPSGDSDIIINDTPDPGTQISNYVPPKIDKMTYKVKKNESLWSIARDHGITVQDLASENNISAKSGLKIGQKLTLPSGARYMPRERKSSTSSSPKVAAGSQIYKVKKGDSLSVIAWKFKTNISALKKANGLKSNTIRVNQKLTIPNSNTARTYKPSKQRGNSGSFKVEGNVYTVKKGDTLSEIAQKHGIKTKELKKANGLTSNNIFIGKKLVIPGGAKVKSTPAKSPASDLQKQIEDELIGTDDDKPENTDDDNSVTVTDEPKTDEEDPGTEEDTTTDEDVSAIDTMEVLLVESDTLESLASDFNTTVDLILKVNKDIAGNDDLKAGKLIKVPR